MPRYVFAAFMMFGVLILCATSLHAEDNQVLIDRLDRMERDMQSLQMEVFRDSDDSKPQRRSSAADGGGGNQTLEASAISKIDARMSAIEKTLRELTGRVEEIGYKLAQTQNFFDKYATDQELRLQALDQKIQATAAALAAMTPPAPAPQSNANLPPSTDASPPAPTDPKAQYDQAIASLQNADYPLAEKQLRAFIQANPKDALSANAQYWLGETHYVQGDFQGAAVEFLKSYKQSPKGPKAPDSLLKLALSLSNSDKKREACASFAKLAKEFPKAGDAIKSRADGESKKLKCGI